jgi:class 3 adenylate cyclase
MLFVDIAGFTTVCERVPPDVLSDLVSQYFDRASRIVMEHDGQIDKYIGDCIMAVWGAPFAVASQEVKATLTAKLLDRATMVAPLSTVWDAEGELLRVRVGVSTGEVLAGNMGSADRMNYTVIGDPVNLAARLESLNKQFGTRVMVSEMTAERLAGVFVLRLLLPIAVVGKEKPVRVFEVMGLAPDAPNAACVDASTELAAAAARDGRSDAASDLSTVVSVGTRNGGGGGRAKRRTTAQMLTDALFSTATALPVACGAEEVAFAAGYSQAVAAYMAGEFAPALEQLGALEQQHPSLCGGKSEKSAGLLRELCEAYVREGAPQGFDGVYRALEK